MPELRLSEHENSDDAPYRIWAAAGLLTLTNGEGTYGIKTDYHFITAELSAIITAHNLQVVGCGYDGHNAGAFLPDLDSVLDCDLTEIKQSARSLNDATIDFQLSVKAGTVVYDKHNALLTWSMVNATISRPNSFGEIKIDKITQTNRIDPCDAIIDAWKLYFSQKRDEKPDGSAALSAWLDITEKKEGE